MGKNRVYAHRAVYGAVFGALISASPAFTRTGNADSPLGTNFWFFWDSQYVWPFVDFFKQSRSFWSSSESQWDDGRQLDLDSNGYPNSLASGQSAATLLFWDGNEVWNGGVQGNVDYVVQVGESLGFTGWSAQHRGWAKRLADMLAVVTEVYAGQMERCVRVVATQVGNTGVGDGICTYYGAGDLGDAFAVAPYFGPDGGGTLDQLIASVAQEAAQVGDWVRGDLAIANRYGMNLVCYESGLDVWGLDEDMKIAVRFDPRMKDIYKTYLSAWKQGGGTLMVQYTFCNPYWGILKYMDQDPAQAPMYSAALEWIEQNPRWWDEERMTRAAPIQARAASPSFGLVSGDDGRGGG